MKSQFQQEQQRLDIVMETISEQLSKLEKETATA
ncbi:DNA helicase IV OS=Lysinibacillus sphaericus OX=1421 GN=helD_2 PE=4 SV=1 [Lysinibacillus sphaericus]